MKKVLIFGSAILIMATFCWSCHLEDFNLDKLAVAKDIKPVVYAPLAYGTYKVGDLHTFALPDNDTVKVNEIDLNPIIYDKSGVLFNIAAIDSVYLVVDFTNGTPMKMQILLNFIDLKSGAVYGETFDSGIIPAGKMDATGNVAESVTARAEFPMNASDLNNITLASGMEFQVKLFQPDNGSVIVKYLKASIFKVQMSFRAPLSLWKL